MTQIYQSYYLGLILQEEHTGGRIDDKSPQISKLKPSVRAHRATSDRGMSPEQRVKYLAEIAAQFRGHLRRYEW